MYKTETVSCYIFTSDLMMIIDSFAEVSKQVNSLC